MKNMENMANSLLKTLNKKVEHIEKEVAADVEQREEGLIFNVDSKAKEKCKNITITLNEKLFGMIEKQAIDVDGKTSTIIKNVLKKIYNKNTGRFDYEIEEKESPESKSLSANLPVEIIKSLDEISKETKKSKSEIVEELLSKYIEDRR